jgi:hypothetical protein
VYEHGYKGYVVLLKLDEHHEFTDGACQQLEYALVEILSHAVGA